ncbi:MULTISPECIES: hypothetical protein [unclassified Brevundimonas]|uniref:hypothetical protein n=1 Tax=unclassified Brevundimonas TaxID=2622653 RepID=UPI000CFD7D59|nr:MULTISPECIES: hypothetical protein [unclassified Brevundimonas]PQZ74063.1 hypothetical protein CQ026_15810 [Brevundimonas sp. MYb31]PRB10807.1 hypothetical protein CQ039_15985 [Brevundimonas sp. MYb52]PRB32405.1 hypothetical protein CQ035_15990 [Brevundimonas sp. MYb46]PRB50294.1 hypothetical protein CQ028_07710 [Brevundimonas sp. MYb33]
MSQAFLRRGLSVAAIAAAAALASCSTPEPEAPPPPPPPPLPAVSLNEGVAQAASVYVAFVREVSTIQGGFTDAESIQAAIRKGAAYEPGQLSRGMIAYGSILALQSPEYVAGVRQFASTPALRQQMIASIVADPAYAATLPGADSAAGLITATMGKDIAALTAIAEAVEGDAYTIQERRDPRRRWAVTPIADRNGRLEGAKSLSVSQLPSAEESARLFAAANSGAGLNLTPAQRGAPFTPAVVNSLAIAALAALGAAGDDARTNTEALSTESNNEFCLNMSKLMLFQCLAASRPSYEDMFCTGRHIVRDLATCTAQYTGPVPISTAPTVTVAETPPAPGSGMS